MFNIISINELAIQSRHLETTTRRGYDGDMVDIHPTEEDFKNIRNKILDYLSRQGFSERKLLEKVTRLKKNYPHSARYTFYTSRWIQRVIDDLKKEGFIDDKKYAQDVLRQLKNKQDGILRIKEKMYRRLIPPSIIEEVLAGFNREGRTQSYEKIIKNVKRKKEELQRKKIPKKEHQMRLYAFLAQKGFLPDDIQQIMQQTQEKEINE